MDFWEIFRSVEIVWLLWITSLVTFGFVFRQCLIQLGQTDFRAMMRRLHWRHLHHDQHGAAYSIAFILVLPFLVFLIALIIETSFMLVAKIGTMHAAFAAARTGAVWSTEDTSHSASDVSPNNGILSLGHDKAEQAARIAMVPYASGTGNVTGNEQDARDYYRIYSNIQSKYPENSVKSWGKELNENYIQKKYRYAVYATTVKLSLEGGASKNTERWEKYVQAEVSYQYPFHILPVGRALMGNENKDGIMVYAIKSSARINNECPRNEKGKLGIQIIP